MIRDLAILLNANVPLVTALTILAESAPTKSKPILNNIKSNVESGLPLSKSCSQYPKLYSPLTCKLLEAGERAAALPTILNNLADYHDKITEFKSRVIKAIFYPIVVFVIAILISTALLLFIVPQFESLFVSMGAELPFLTRLVIGISNLIKNYWYLIIFVVLGFGGLVYFQAKKLLHLPLISKINNKIIIARLARTLAILLDAGVPLVDALYLMSELAAREQILRGEMLSNALQSTGRFSPLMIQMIKVGEASGKLSHMLSRVAVITETEIDAVLSKVTQLLEPCIMIFMGVFIGGLVIAMYLPVFQLGRVV
ncbi:MAG TPA: type II secretion system F family protein [Gammaproteobacteria bacterium]|nr:type II secretion system F family protein [Gammaproteobacteria bacterium]